MDRAYLLQQARKTLQTLPIGTVFVVKDLFIGTEWNSMEKKDKLNFGRVFKEEVTEGNIGDVTYIGKEKNNSAKYEKVEG